MVQSPLIFGSDCEKESTSDVFKLFYVAYRWTLKLLFLAMLELGVLLSSNPEEALYKST